jgi:poly [ADP-ribose] polymerase
MLCLTAVRPGPGGIGIMFLNEVALGKEKHIAMDDSSLIRAPKGFDSVVARGRQEPSMKMSPLESQFYLFRYLFSDPKQDTSIVIDGNEVVVPQGSPVNQKEFSNSSFFQSEYLIYRESQNRIRYMLKIKF